MMAELLILTLGGVAGGLAVAAALFLAGVVPWPRGYRPHSELPVITMPPDAPWWQDQEPRCPHCGTVTYSLELHPRERQAEGGGERGATGLSAQVLYTVRRGR